MIKKFEIVKSKLTPSPNIKRPIIGIKVIVRSPKITEHKIPLFVKIAVVCRKSVVLKMRVKSFKQLKITAMLERFVAVIVRTVIFSSAKIFKKLRTIIKIKLKSVSFAKLTLIVFAKIVSSLRVINIALSSLEIIGEKITAL